MNPTDPMNTKGNTDATKPSKKMTKTLTLIIIDILNFTKST